MIEKCNLCHLLRSLHSKSLATPMSEEIGAGGADFLGILSFTATGDEGKYQNIITQPKGQIEKGKTPIYYEVKGRRVKLTFETTAEVDKKVAKEKHEEDLRNCQDELAQIKQRFQRAVEDGDAQLAGISAIDLKARETDLEKLKKQKSVMLLVQKTKNEVLFDDSCAFEINGTKCSVFWVPAPETPVVMETTVTEKTERLVTKFSQEKKILVLGLDGAGKTVILYMKKLGLLLGDNPTIGFNVESVDHEDMRLTLWDVGGANKLRVLWAHYYQNTDGIIFVVDSDAPERLPEASAELQKLLKAEELKDARFCVFANKQDLPTARSLSEIVEALCLHSILDHEWSIHPCCAKTGDGLEAGFDWLVS
jgi:small GTP-binding protein